MPRKKGSKNRAKVVDTVSVASIEEKIAVVEAEIAAINDSLKTKKAELKALTKEKVKAEEAEALKKAEEDKKAILAAIEASGKSVEEILELLG